MKFNEINAKFTAKVAEYIANGYMINSRSMSGSQGEIGKVDLLKGDELIRVWLNRESSSNWTDEEAWHGDMVVLRISRWNEQFNEKIDRTIWISDLITIEEYTYFAIGGYYTNWFVDCLDEALEYQTKRSARYRRDPNAFIPAKINDPKAIEIAGNWLKRRHGYQRLSWNKIELYKYNNSRRYVVDYNNHRYLLG